MVKWTGHLRPSARHLRTRRFGGPRSFREQSDGVRVAHLTDQHVGPVTPHALQRAAIDAANASRPDLVLLTGDYVGHGLDYLDAVEELLSALDAPAYAVLGNHDHWADADAVRATLKRAGVCVLDNAWTELRVRGVSLQLVGVDDAHTGHDDAERATSGLDPDTPTLAMSHVGEVADELWANGADLVLSGHTHAGQISMGNLADRWLSRLGHRYTQGWYGCRDRERAPGALYVSAGIGSSRFSPRIGERAQPELGIHDLHLSPSAADEPVAEAIPAVAS